MVRSDDFHRLRRSESAAAGKSVGAVRDPQSISKDRLPLMCGAIIRIFVCFSIALTMIRQTDRKYRLNVRGRPY